MHAEQLEVGPDSGEEKDNVEEDAADVVVDVKIRVAVLLCRGKQGGRSSRVNISYPSHGETHIKLDLDLRQCIYTTMILPVVLVVLGVPFRIPEVCQG